MTNIKITSSVDEQYLALVKTILSKLDKGTTSDRTGAGRLRIFSHQMRFDVRNEFPLLQLKKTHFPSIVKELAWFISGSTNIQDLDCSIWNEWSCKEENDYLLAGSIGPMYGYQWRTKVGLGPGFVMTTEDQLDNIIQEAISNPSSSRLIVNSWDPNLIPRRGLSVKENLERGYMALAPCHFAFQLFCEEIDGVVYMDLKTHCRSQDVMLGTPFNISSYALLLMLIAKKCGYVARELIFDMGDTHIYGNHLDMMEEFIYQAQTFIKERNGGKDWKPVKLVIPDHVTIDNIQDNIDEIVNGLENYNPKPHIKFPRN